MLRIMLLLREEKEWVLDVRPWRGVGAGRVVWMVTGRVALVMREHEGVDVVVGAWWW